MLSEAEKKNHLLELVDNSLEMIKQTELRIMIYDSTGCLVWANEITNEFIPFIKWQDLVGRSYDNLPPELQKRVCEEFKLDHSKFTFDCKTVHQLHLKAIKCNKTLEYLDLYPYPKNHHSYKRTITPILYQSEEIIGIAVVATNHTLFGFADILKVIEEDDFDEVKFQQSDSLLFDLKLSPRQHEITFLLALGVTQSLTARILQVKQGTITKIVSEQICPKFEIFPPNIPDLIKKAIKLGYSKLVPESLWKRKIVVLD